MENIKIFFKKHDINFFYPVSFILTIVPLIVRMTPLIPDQDTLNTFGQAAASDLFSQKKALFLLIFCIILIGISIIFFKKIFKQKDRVINSILIASAVFFIFTLLSSIFSSYKHEAFYGIYDRSEGFITITCYLILFIYCLYTFKNTKDYKYITTPILILVSINAFLGLFQYIGQDLIQTNLGKLIVLPSKYYNPNVKMNLLYAAGKLYGTLYHYDYVGSFVAIVLPILFCLTLFEHEDVMYKINLGIGSLLSIWLLFGSTSRAGIIGVVVAIIFGIIIFWHFVKLRWKNLLIILSSLLVIAIGLNFATKGKIFERVPSLINDTLTIFKNTNNVDYRESSFLKDVKLTDKDAEIILKNDTLKISYENNNFIFRNSQDEIINYIKNGKVFTTTNENFKDISFNIGKLYPTSTKNDGLILMINNQTSFVFLLRDDNKIHLINPNNKNDINITYPDTLKFLTGKEKLGSARGYIWGRSLPMLKDNIILGGGPDTFVFRFPQNDLIGKYYTYNTTNIIVDKPHNLFLQIALNEGVIALLAFLTIMIIYIVDSIKLYALKKDYRKSEILGAATFLGIIGYLFSGVFNDSVISVAPVFWIVLGIGASINYINRTNS